MLVLFTPKSRDMCRKCAGSGLRCKQKNRTRCRQIPVSIADELLWEIPELAFPAKSVLR
jgi:hypothetical protein